MRASGVLFCGLISAVIAPAQPRIDNVIVKMTPPGSTSLVGARMDRIRGTELYAKLVARQQLPQVDQFARETGFDPRRDVRELLFASTPSGGVLLARGNFHLNRAPLRNTKTIRHSEYVIQSREDSGFCILDTTLAAAGDLQSLEAALDEWKSGTHKAAQPLLDRAKAIDSMSPFWGVSTGFAGFLADHMPRAGSGIDFSRIFKGLEDTWFQSDLSAGLRGEVHGSTSNETDATNLRDAAKGLIGFGRLSVPENQPELLKFWDAIKVEQQGRSVTIRADIPPDLIDQLVQILNTGRGGRAR